MISHIFTAKRLRAFLQFVTRKRASIIAGALLLTGLCTWLAKQLPLESNLIALLPDDTPTIRALHEVLTKTSGAGDLMVMIESPDFDASLKYAESLKQELIQKEWVAKAEYGRDVSFFEKYQAYYMNLEDLTEIRDRIKKRQQFENKKSLIGDLGLGGEEEAPAVDFSDIEEKYKSKSKAGRYFADAERKLLLLVIYPSGVTNDLGFARVVFKGVEDLVARSNPASFHPKMNVNIGGTFRNRIDEFEVITSDVVSSAVWVGVGLVLLLAFYYRSLWAIPIIGLPLVMSIAWTFGLTFLTIGRLNIITIFLIVVLLGLGIDFGIHILTRFQSERRTDKDLISMLEATIGHAGRAALTASLTTAVAFVVLAFSDFRGLSEFGLIAAFGLMMSSVAFLVVGPAVFSYAHDWGLMKPKGQAQTTVGKPLPRAGLILGVCCLITVGAMIFAPKAAFEHDLRNIRSVVQSRTDFNTKMRLVFSKARDPSLIIVKDADEAKKVAQAINDRRKKWGKKNLVLEARSINDVMPKDLAKKIALMPDLAERVDLAIPELQGEQKERAEAFVGKLKIPPPSGVDALPEDVRLPFIGRPDVPGQLVYVFQSDSLMDLNNALGFAQQVGDFELDGKHYRPASEALVFADLWKVIRGDVPISLAAAALVLMILIWLDVRSLKALGLILIPLTVGLIWMAAIMAIVPIKLNLLNVAVLASVLGLGIDGGIHIYHRYKELGAGQMTLILRDTGGAIAAASGTSMIGFGGMLSAQHPGLRSIGVLALVGLGACLVTSVVLLPALLSVLHQRHKNKAAT